MFIARIAGSLAREERNGHITTSNISLLRSFKVHWTAIVYKHLVPLGPKQSGNPCCIHPERGHQPASCKMLPYALPRLNHSSLSMQLLRQLNGAGLSIAI